MNPGISQLRMFSSEVFSKPMSHAFASVQLPSLPLVLAQESNEGEGGGSERYSGEPNRKVL